MTQIHEQPGRIPCANCDGDVGTPCATCGGCGTVLPVLLCHCSRPLQRYGWHFPDASEGHAGERLPRFRCRLGHLVAINFTPADERQAA